MRCFCGCGGKVAARHHVFYVQHLKDAAMHGPIRGLKVRALVADERNLVPVAFQCHQDHHRGARPRQRYPLVLLPGSVFEFGVEVFGAGRAYEYLRRRYRGDDPRLDVLVLEPFREGDGDAG